ncbi:hypothetical protein [Xylocopilactobacillus apis]|uniref:PTS EIIC type-1 domain-containing protein n=1 Tax=Xylocopilactobacillus apis TaxID=2932183 RepID=A0AAU9D5Z7_9LACO|nr:hypothetical protein [Xylocopilactobacillus apis]BDR56830.1 hypothetical protein KIMC2_13920 [Xylocopilactobacillus apis]
MLLAFTEAQKLKSNQNLAVPVTAIMLHSTWSSLVLIAKPVHFFGIIPFTLANYSGSVIPILLVVFVQAYLERFLNRIIPKSVNLVFIPMLTFLIMGTLSLWILTKRFSFD